MKKSTTLALRFASAAAVASMFTGVLAGGASAAPAQDPTEIWPAQVESAAAFTALSCVEGGPTAADTANAAALNPLLANKMRGHMNGYNVSCARAVVQAVKARGLNERAAAIAISTTIVETSIANLDGGDLDSVGLFQQRNSWGSFAERTNPPVATNKFLDVMQNFYPNGSWNSAAIGDVAADVQRPAAQYRYRYGVEAADSVTIAHHLWGGSTGTFGKADLVRVNEDGSLTTWQNNNALAGSWHGPAGIGGAGTADPTRLRYADLDADGKADLIRIDEGGSLTAWKNHDALAGSWSAPGSIGGTGSTDQTRIRFADLNADGKADLIRVNEDGTLTAWQNNNALAGSWSAPGSIGGTGTGDPSRVRLADLNADGKADLVVVNADSTLTAWQNNNALAGSWSAPGSIGGTGTTDQTRIRFADLNADGKADVISIGADGALTAWQNNNALAGSWSAPTGIGGTGTTDHTRMDFADLG